MPFWGKIIYNDNMKQKQRIGILGGTFHPIHNGHIKMAQQAMRCLNLDVVNFMVDRIPPHKELVDGATAAQRLEMTKIVCSEHEGFIANDMELYREGRSYTADTLDEFSKLHPDAELFFIMGSDMFRTLDSWYQPERIMQLATVVCIRRLGQEGLESATEEQLRAHYNAKLVLLPPVEELSSSQVRARIAAYLPISQQVPRAVEYYIYSNGLYFTPQNMELLAKLKKRLTPNRFLHTVGVMITAVQLAQDNGVDGQKALVAALLHDCAKPIPLDELVSITGEDEKYAPILHAAAGAIIAKNEFSITDGDVLNAIRLHTTGDANMTALDKIIYLADMIEPGRNFEGIGQIRKEKTLDAAVLLALRRSIWYIKSNGGVLHPSTLHAYQYLGGMNG